MIDDATIHNALRAVLDGGGVPSEHVYRLGDEFTPPAHGVHLRTSLVWISKKKTGAVLTEGEGYWQVLVYAPSGTTDTAVEATAMGVGLLYEPYVDGPELAGIRITDVATLTVTTAGHGGEGGPASWIVAPLQVDFRLEQIPDGIV